MYTSAKIMRDIIRLDRSCVSVAERRNSNFQVYRRSRQVVYNKRSGVRGKLVRKTGPLNGKLCAQQTRARAHGHQAFRAIIVMQSCDVTLQLT